MRTVFFLVAAFVAASMSGVCQAAQSKVIPAEVLNETTFSPTLPGPYPVLFKATLRGQSCFGSMQVTWTFRSNLKSRATGQVDKLVCDDKDVPFQRGDAIDHKGVVGLSLACGRTSLLGCETAVLKKDIGFRVLLLQSAK